MDPTLSWLQPEQEGPAKHMWLRIWQTQQEFENMNVVGGANKDDTSSNDMESLNNAINAQNQLNNGKNTSGPVFPQQQHRRRKVENRASIRGMFHHREQVLGEFGGCPWIKTGKTYSRGIVG